MNNPSKFVSLKLLPIFLIFALIAGAGFFLLQGEIKLPWLNNKNTRNISIRRLEGYPTVVSTRSDVSKQRAIIKSEDELLKFLKTVDSKGNLALGEKINFNKEYIIGVATGTVLTENNSIKIKTVTLDNSKNLILVSIEQVRPDESCDTETRTDAVNVPVDMVVISKTDLPIDFEVIKKVGVCK